MSIKPRVLLASPSVAPHVKQSVLAYENAGMLGRFYTTFFSHPANRLSRILQKFSFIGKEVNRRSFTELPIDKFKSRPLPELLRSAAARKMNAVFTDKIWEWAELGFDKWVAGSLKKEQPHIVHTYEHAAFSILKRAHKLGIFSVYEQPSQHHSFFTSVARQQMNLYPQLNTESALLLTNEKAERRNRRRDKELELADMILCNSTFTKNTLMAAGISPEKVKILPLAFPPVRENKPEKAAGKPLAFLHAGNQSLRKGSHLLYEAWRKCQFSESEAELWLVGKMQLPESMRKNLPGKVLIKPNLPQQELLDLYNQADVFVLPTLADGFGMVVTEAMANGLPVMATQNCCAPDLIEHGKNGWILPAGEIGPLVENMRALVQNPFLIKEIGINAIKKARNWQWPDYQQTLTELVTLEWEKRSAPSA